MGDEGKEGMKKRNVSNEQICFSQEKKERNSTKSDKGIWRMFNESRNYVLCFSVLHRKC